MQTRRKEESRKERKEKESMKERNPTNFEKHFAPFKNVVL